MTISDRNVIIMCRSCQRFLEVVPVRSTDRVYVGPCPYCQKPSDERQEYMFEISRKGDE